MTYKMIVLDLDDTLLRDDHSMSERTITALMEAQQQGVKVVLASGRPTYGMNPVAEQLKLHEYGSFILSYNGANIIDYETKEVQFSSALNPDVAHRLYELSKRENVFIHTYIGDEIITETENEYTTIEGNITGLPVKVAPFIETVQEPVVKVLMCEDPEKLVKVEKILKEEFAGALSIMRSKPYFLEFLEPGVTKGSSLQSLIETLGIKQEEVIAMGDSYNDEAMIRFAGLGVAMGNAPDDIKAIADHVTDTNMNDGVAKVIEEFVLSKTNV
ncbi:haloacid dehalogenase-like hydrolase [Halalkalibacter wakoensis JCM 9140]|uniref:Haloacid dehalogenase-like hydrolase n=1 Tax=Halalkalibacter wakoensis JCM 9140 TaxID=1236970 RepID=W4QA74_9BACI|nr:Cof-type HAD-IIB family hydrolase [Halalkalibacter wakoensis]GAE28299.1 haloacid dehalogenase-like hydrolase [Halalkalibacter wakoensis JCM 9140]